MKANFIKEAEKEYQNKLKLAKRIGRYYHQKVKELNLSDFSRMKAYLDAYLPESNPLISRDIIFAHLGFEPFTSQIAQKKEFTVISGLNPSSPLHLGHKVMFDLLLFLQKLGANIFIPITNDESYLDGKVASLAESRRIAYEEIIPSIIAFGFDPRKTKIFVMSDYPEIYNLAIYLSKYVTNEYIATLFGKKSVENSGQAFYRCAVQLAQILLPQLKEFGGAKNTLIPVGIDQHPYILLARDVAKKVGLVPPSELVFKFQPSLKNPFEKMSGSKPATAIYLNDSPEIIRQKIEKTFTGSVSALSVHRKLGGVPEACSVFSLLYSHCQDDKFVSNIYKRYKEGKITAGEIKKITADFIVDMVGEHQARRKKVNSLDDFILDRPLKSLLSYDILRRKGKSSE